MGVSHGFAAVPSDGHPQNGIGLLNDGADNSMNRAWILPNGYSGRARVSHCGTLTYRQNLLAKRKPYGSIAAAQQNHGRIGDCRAGEVETNRSADHPTLGPARTSG